MKAKIEVMLKNGVFDPQGKVILNALHHLDYTTVSDVRSGKLFIIEIDENDSSLAMQKLNEMGDRLFANPIIENYRIELLDE